MDHYRKNKSVSKYYLGMISLFVVINVNTPDQFDKKFVYACNYEELQCG